MSDFAASLKKLADGYPLMRYAPELHKDLTKLHDELTRVAVLDFAASLPELQKRVVAGTLRGAVDAWLAKTKA